MHKILAVCLGICIVLCSASAIAQKSIDMSSSKVVDGTKASSAMTNPTDLMAGSKARTPDLIVQSASVTGVPTASGDVVLMPLQITVKNQGGRTSEDFNVGAQGHAVDGNAYGFTYVVIGENHMPDPRYGVLVSGLDAGASKTFNGFLVMRSQPTDQPLNPGTSYEITAMVDYNLDPDSFGYAWGVAESNENNNQLTVNYPA
jgi:hypothetical protein